MAKAKDLPDVGTLSIQRHREERETVRKQGMQIMEEARKANRDMTPEESDKVDGLFDLSDAHDLRIDFLTKAEERNKRAETYRAEGEERTHPSRGRQSEGRRISDMQHATGKALSLPPSWKRSLDEDEDAPALAYPESLATKEYRANYSRFLRTGRMDMTDEQRQVNEERALQADSDSAGGYTLAPMQFVAQLIKAVDNIVFLRGLATVIPLQGAHSLGVPTLEADPADADWTGEITSVSEDSTMSFGRRELNPTTISKLLKVSRKLIRTSALPIEQIVIDRLAYKFGVTEEKAFLTGHGSGQPLGLFTASSAGISTARDVLTGSATNFTADGLINARYTLKEGYVNERTRWLFHRDGVKLIRKLKGSDNNYLWQPGLAAGQPDTLLGIGIGNSEYAPNTFTTGLYVGLLGDMRYYWIAESIMMDVQALFELYAGTNQVGYIGRMAVDGMPVLEDAFVRLKTD